MKKVVYVCFIGFLFCISLLSFVFTQQKQAQEKESQLRVPFQVAREELLKGNYLAPLVELRELEESYMSSRLKRSFLNVMGCYNSFVGNIEEALFYSDKMREPYPDNIRAVDFGFAQPTSALQLIGSIADSYRVVIINENHYVPQHRAFSIHLLRILKSKGFNYFAAETLNENDTELGTRGYPLVTKSGWYAREPVYGDLIRTASILGFKVVPYEFMGESPEGESPIEAMKRRELGQAQNLHDRVFKQDSSAKLFVHCGGGHLFEKEIGYPVKRMAQHLKELVGIDPFTIDQIRMTEHSSRDYEHPQYRFALENNLIKEPTIFETKEGDYWVEEEYRDHVDAQVFHPRTHKLEGRPGWLELGGARKPYRFPNDTYQGNLPCLVQAFVSSEDSEAVPIDQIEISDLKGATALMLPSEIIKIRVIGRDGKVIREFSVDLSRN